MPDVGGPKDEAAGRAFWTGGLCPPARDWSSPIFRAIAHVYLASVAGLTRLFGGVRGSPGRASDRAREPGRGLRVLAIGPFFSENWVAAHLEALAHCELVDRVSVITPRPFRPIEKLEYVRLSPSLARRFGDGVARVWSAIGLVRRDRPDLIIGYHLPWNALMALLIARFFKCQVFYFSVGGPAEFLGGGCYSEHALFTRIGGESRSLERRFIHLIGRFDAVLTMGTRSRDLFLSLDLPVPIEPISVGVSDSKFAGGGATDPASPTDERDFDVVTVGRLAQIKRIDLLIQAVATIDAGKRPRVAIVGDGGEADALRSLTRTLGVDGSVEFLGWREDVEAVLRRSGCFVMSSASEGLPLALIEAMLSGLPAIVPIIGDIPDLVEDGVSGYLFRPGDVGALARRISQVLASEPDRQAMCRAARSHAVRYTISARAGDWQELLDRLAPANEDSDLP